MRWLIYIKKTSCFWQQNVSTFIHKYTHPCPGSHACLNESANKQKARVQLRGAVPERKSPLPHLPELEMRHALGPNVNILVASVPFANIPLKVGGTLFCARELNGDRPKCFGCQGQGLARVVFIRHCFGVVCQRSIGEVSRWWFGVR